ncbi:MAG: hypothetical protein JJU36_15695 [Phycisphaeraceae bacterium]|nr:hypothetical protein [Phycisphaeraceae bacterium]
MVVVDLGFSSRNRSAGIVSPTHCDGQEMEFGKAVGVVVEAVLSIFDEEEKPLLVIEAPLSKLFVRGNPSFRFKTEEERGW